MRTLRETRDKIVADPENWLGHLMYFVDDFRRRKDLRAVTESFELVDERVDALLASTAEYLCDEIGVEPPTWLFYVPACRNPYFFPGIEGMKATLIVESPLRFRIRQIFVLENFLSRV
jgi:hypothetical protein